MESIDDRQKALIEEMGLFAERYGSQRNTGRVLAAVMISGRPLTQEDLMGMLNLSRTSASVALRWLERLGYVQTISEPGNRKRCYRPRSDMTAWMTRVTFRQIGDELRIWRMAEDVAHPAARAQIALVREMTDFINQRLETAFNDWCRSHEDVCDPTQLASPAALTEASHS